MVQITNIKVSNQLIQVDSGVITMTPDANGDTIQLGTGVARVDATLFN